MVDRIRALLAEMADELDHNRRCLLDDASLTDPLADRARAVLAAAQGEGPTHRITPDDFRRWWRETGSASPAPSPEMLLTANAWAEYCLRRWGRPAQPAPPAEGEVAELSPKEIEARDAFTAMRDEILHGLDGFDPDQTNAVLDVIDNHTPEWV